MKKVPIFLWFLLPMLACVLLLPPLSLYVFRTRAEDQALVTAEKDLRALQQEIAQLAAETLPVTSPRETRMQPFLRSVSGIISRTGGSARLLLYAEGERLIYPMETDAAEAEGLAAAVAGMLGNTSQDTVIRTEVDEEAYLVYISPSPIQTKRLTWLVTYCPIASIGTWATSAGRTVLLLSLGLCIVFVLMVFLMVHPLTRSLERVADAAQKIRQRDFITVKKPFPTKELESLRLSINAMSEQLKNADRKEKAFFQNVSHELRTPLMSIGGYAQGIEQGVFSDDQEAAHIILAESQRLTEMVQGLLTLSRLDQQDEAPILSDHSVAELLDGAVDRINGIALRKGITVERKDETSGMELRTDEKRLGLILDNLLSNAVRYAKTTVWIDTAIQGDNLILTVADDGDGIEEKDLPYIFDRCYTGKGGHNGLGLAIAQAAAKSIGAELTAKNGPEGAVFTLTLRI